MNLGKEFTKEGVNFSFLLSRRPQLVSLVEEHRKSKNRFMRLPVVEAFRCSLRVHRARCAFEYSLTSKASAEAISRCLLRGNSYPERENGVSSTYVRFFVRGIDDRCFHRIRVLKSNRRACKRAAKRNKTEEDATTLANETRNIYLVTITRRGNSTPR